MSKKSNQQETIQYTRRAFLKYASVGVMFPTVLGMLPHVVGGRAYAQSEKKLPDKWLELASKYGSPSGKFGKIGDPVTLTIGYQPYCTPYWTSSVNKQAKIWSKYLPPGSQVVWFRALSGPLINNNMITGKNQFGYMAETPALYAGEHVDCDLVAATGYDVGEIGSFCVRKDLFQADKIKVAKDLEGQSVGTPFGSFSHRQILTWVDQNQVNIKLLNQSIEQQRTGLKTRQIAAGVLWEPYSQWLEHKEVANRWITGQEMPCSCQKHVPVEKAHTFRVVGATLAIHEWLRERPDIIAAYLKSEEECRDMLTHQPDLAAYHIWSDIPEVPPAVVRVTLDMMVWDGRLTLEVKQHLKGCAKMWRQQNFLKKERTANPDQFIETWAENRFLDYALEEMRTQGMWNSSTLPGFPKEIRPDQLTRHHWKTYEALKLEAKSWQQTKI